MFSPILAVDVMLATAQANPYWYGAVQAPINCPSQSIDSQFLSQVERIAKPRNTWNTVTFPPTARIGYRKQGGV